MILYINTKGFNLRNPEILSVFFKNGITLIKEVSELVHSLIWWINDKNLELAPNGTSKPIIRIGFGIGYLKENSQNWVADRSGDTAGEFIGGRTVLQSNAELLEIGEALGMFQIYLTENTIKIEIVGEKELCGDITEDLLKYLPPNNKQGYFHFKLIANIDAKIKEILQRIMQMEVCILGLDIKNLSKF